MKLCKSRSGFTAIHILFALVLIGIIGLAGWKVHKVSKPTDINQTKTYVVPAPKKESEFMEYKNTTEGFRIQYPRIWGEPKMLADNGTNKGRSYELDFYPIKTTTAHETTPQIIIVGFQTDNFSSISDKDKPLGPYASKAAIEERLSSIKSGSRLTYSKILKYDDFSFSALSTSTGSASFEIEKVLQLSNLHVSGAYASYSFSLGRMDCVQNELSSNSMDGCVTQAVVDILAHMLDSLQSI